MLINQQCMDCILRKNLNKYPPDAPAGQVRVWQRRVRELVAGSGGSTSPQLHGQISALYREMFGPLRDYSPQKRRFNAVMLGLEGAMQADVDAAEDPLTRAVQYAMVGNFIDFAALGEIDEGELRKKLAGAGALSVDRAVLEALRREAASAGRLVCLTDNCGEIVADKVLLRTLRRLNPDLHITVLVRGGPVVNDATMEDAEQVGLREVADAVSGSGCDLPGTVLSRVSEAALAALDGADVIISKGQANYEGLSGCGRNVFYIFMCKCDMFARRFNVPLLAGVLTREQGRG